MTTEAVIAAVENEGDLADAVVRLTVRRREDQQVDVRAIGRALDDAGVHRHTINVETERAARQRVEGFHAGLDPYEALFAWLDANDYTGSRRPIHELLNATLADLSRDHALGGTFTPVQLEAENVCRFRHLTHEFKAGATALVGPNGAGKSTILRCVELALFANGARDLRPWLAPWADEMRIELVFDLDGRRYRVRRGFRRGRSATLDFEIFEGDGSPQQPAPRGNERRGT